MTTLRDAAQQALAEPQTTHSADCYKWHHQCAIAEVQRLRITLAEKALDRMAENARELGLDYEPVQKPEPCQCGDRPSHECPGEWEPGCGLGNSSKHTKRAESVQDGPCKYCTDGCPACDAGKLPMVEIETVLTVQGEPVQEPVAWMYDCGNGGRMYAEELDDVPGWIPLYTAPSRCPNCASLEAQNTELDRRLAEMEREPVQEPVAWRITDGEGDWEYRTELPEDWSIQWSARYGRKYEPLYTAPPQRKPLTDDQLDDIAVAARRGNLYDLRIAIERTHGIIESKIKGDKNA